MSISRSLICLCLIGWSIATFAQSIDTVYHDNPEFPYSLVEMDGKGRPHGVAHVYDTSGVVRIQCFIQKVGYMLWESMIKVQ
jgi:hypothetical protein